MPWRVMGVWANRYRGLGPGLVLARTPPSALVYVRISSATLVNGLVWASHTMNLQPQPSSPTRHQPQIPLCPVHQ